ncbi:hypothetical protein CDG79_34985 [Nostoc sp. 'Peltigera membranacea cyanobiont' 232]|nr:hypothetical protein CDG79_34985 [Nostoc sp. 'Peltigera membranacea cyanobiont' 232]
MGQFIFETLLISVFLIPLALGLGHFLDFDKVQGMNQKEYNNYMQIIIFKCWIILFLPLILWLRFQATHECTRNLF